MEITSQYMQIDMQVIAREPIIICSGRESMGIAFIAVIMFKSNTGLVKFSCGVLRQSGMQFQNRQSGMQFQNVKVGCSFKTT
jgi:hypothetical protein